MAIYGHMSNKELSHEDSPPDDDGGTESFEMEEKEIDETLSSLMQEAEDLVTSPDPTQQTNQFEENPPHLAAEPEEKRKSDEHFTLANSPTRYQTYSKDTDGDHKLY